MKQTKLIACALVLLLLLGGCGTQKPDQNDPASPPEETEVVVTPNPSNSIPDATTQKAPTKDGETYQAAGMYLGMADNNLLVIIEANPEDGKPEKSYQISPDIDLASLGIEEGNLVDITYTVDNNGVKRVKTISKQY